MQINTHLYLPVEIKVRELEAKLLLAYYAALCGYKAIIGEQLAIEKVSTYMPSGIYFSKGYPNRYKKRLINHVINHRHQLVELDEEGLIINRDNYSNRINTVLNESMEHFYCWGSFQREVILEIDSKLTNRSFVTGNPRFDLLSKKYRELYKENVNRITNKYNPIVLINTRFALYNQIKKSGKDKQPIQEYMKELFNHFLYLVKILSLTFPYLQFIVRPHPNENKLTYEKAFSELNNVKVISEGNVINWILASQLIIHNGCTTGIEAFLLNKPVVAYMPIHNEKFDVALANDLSIKTSNIEEIILIIKDILNNVHREKILLSESNEHKKIFNRYYGVEDGEFAYKNILDCLQQIPARVKHSVRINPTKTNSFKSRTTKYRFPKFEKKEIVKFFKGLNGLEGTNNQFEIKQLDQRVFAISFLKI